MHPLRTIDLHLDRLAQAQILGLAVLRQSLRDQQYLARIDALTGLYCRRVFEDRLEHDLALARRRKSTLTLAYLDVDNFKAVNDIYGRVGGDRVLKEIGRVLKDSIREVDAAAGWRR